MAVSCFPSAQSLVKSSFNRRKVHSTFPARICVRTRDACVIKKAWMRTKISRVLKPFPLIAVTKSSTSRAFTRVNFRSQYIYARKGNEPAIIFSRTTELISRSKPRRIHTQAFDRPSFRAIWEIVRPYSLCRTSTREACSRLFKPVHAQRRINEQIPAAGLSPILSAGI